MSESLIIEGKQYISSRRAAEIAGYSNDYVGQLCRAGKLVCRMIGRFWYVDESSLISHKNTSLKPNQTVFKKKDSVITEVVPAATLTSSVAPTVSVTSVAPDVSVEALPVWEWSVLPDPSLAQPQISGTEAEMASGMTAVTDRGTDLFTHFLGSTLVPASTAVVFAVILTALISHGMFTTNIRSTTTQVADAGSAIVGMENLMSQSIASTWNSAWNGLVRSEVYLASRLGLAGSSSSTGQTPAVVADSSVSPAEPSPASVVPPNLAGKVTAEHAGLVIVPSQGSTTDIAKLETSIQNSFSDNVVVRPNPDGTTGVIQPVFKTVAGHDYLYVLVPVKATSTRAVGVN